MTTESTDLSRLVACADDRGLGFVRNDSDQVWLVDRPPNLRWTVPAPTTQAAVFRLQLAALREEERQLLPPGLPVEPGVTATFTLPTPSLLHLSLHPGVQAVWHTQEAVAEKVTGMTQDGAVRALSRGSATRRSVLTCGLSAYRVSSGLREQSADPGADLSSLLDLRSDVSDCGSALRAAEDDAAARGTQPLVSRTRSAEVVDSPGWRTQATRGLRAAASGLQGFTRIF